MAIIPHYQSLEYEKVGEIFPPVRPGGTKLKVLDFGSGQGRYLRYFLSAGYDVTGTDANPDYLALACEGGFPVIPSDKLFSTNDAQFDVVFVSHVIEHLPPSDLMSLMAGLISLLRPTGRLVIITPLLGDRFYHDFSHIRPYYPQSIRHAFGESPGELSFGPQPLIRLTDIWFFKDPFRTRKWRSFYLNEGLAGKATQAINRIFDWLWLHSAGRIGVTTSWLGVYVRIPEPKE